MTFHPSMLAGVEPGMVMGARRLGFESLLAEVASEPLVLLRHLTEEFNV